MNAPQIVAAALLVGEVLHALSVSLSSDGHVKKTPKSLIFDAIAWAAILIWGGFWS